MARMPEFDYVVINHEGRLDEAVDTVEAILTAEKCRTGREPIAL
jgi:guanylate kinase